MNKYIDVEKLIAKIERLTSQKKKELEKFSDEDYCCSIASSINCQLSGNLEALSIIKSLQQEQSEVELEKEIDEKLDEFVSSEGEREDFTRSVFHFYNLDKSARKEPPEVKLEREIRDYFSKWDYNPYDGVVTMDNGIVVTLSSIQNVARDFFERGRKVRK